VKLPGVIIPLSVRGFDSPSDVFDVEIDASVVSSVRASAHAAAVSGMLLPALADLHVHIDKTHVVDETGACDGDLFKAIDLMASHRERWTAAGIVPRMQRALTEAYASGTRALRTHLDWPQRQPPAALQAFLQVRNEWRDRLVLQCVSLTTLDVFDTSDPVASADADAIAAALAELNRGCDRRRGESAVLGVFVYRNAGLQQKLQQVFALASRHSLDLDFHVDEGLDPQACGLAAIAECTLRFGYQGRVTCGHACSLSMQAADEALRTLQLCARAGIHLVSLPSTNLYLQGAWDKTPVERGITLLTEADRCGVAVSIATDNVADGFYPYGSYDLLDNFALGVQVGHLRPAERWLHSVCTNPARAMGLPWDGRIAPGCPADLIVLAARSRFELLTARGRRRQVIRNGSVLAAAF